jgi:hypothetical protein
LREGDFIRLHDLALRLKVVLREGLAQLEERRFRDG